MASAECAFPGDHEHDHEMCVDAINERVDANWRETPDWRAVCGSDAPPWEDNPGWFDTSDLDGYVY